MLRLGGGRSKKGSERDDFVRVDQEQHPNKIVGLSEWVGMLTEVDLTEVVSPLASQDRLRYAPPA
jgi:hypothetical protein